MKIYANKTKWIKRKKLPEWTASVNREWITSLRLQRPWQQPWQRLHAC